MTERGPLFALSAYSPVPRHSFAHIFDTKLREMSFAFQNSFRGVLCQICVQNYAVELGCKAQTEPLSLDWIRIVRLAPKTGT